MGSIVDDLTEMTTSRMAKIQEHIIESKMDVLNNAVDKANQDIPSSYKTLFNDIRGGGGSGGSGGGEGGS